MSESFKGANATFSHHHKESFLFASLLLMGWWHKLCRWNVLLFIKLWCNYMRRGIVVVFLILRQVVHRLSGGEHRVVRCDQGGVVLEGSKVGSGRRHVGVGFRRSAMARGRQAQRSQCLWAAVRLVYKCHDAIFALTWTRPSWQQVSTPRCHHTSKQQQ